MKKQKYADTIRQKAEPKLPESQPKIKFRLNGFNRLFWSALIAPVATVLYYPINRYIAYPKLGSGSPYVDMNGALVETYFSANTLVRILFYLLFLLSEIVLIRNAYGTKGWKKAGILLLGTALSFIGGLIFLEFSLWS